MEPLERTPHEQPEENAFLYGNTPDTVIPGHKYDGIKEYDNPMPGWWVWLFAACVAFAPVYVLGLNVFGLIGSYEDDLAVAQADLEARRIAYAEANPGFNVDAYTLREMASDPAAIAAGEGIYAAVCAACHGNQGEGLIGPNLADRYWLHGNEGTAIYQVIAEGVLTAGMPGWNTAYRPEQLAQVTAFVQSLAGTSPPNAKPPQGERY